ncbi:hypothetical protein B0H15DRAFT_387452 [Mycena belliarum]|uniref:Uncharacterized protein n=1 Tax=Mycena belliarum TaxID=1033014 RepID=A0AAD6U1J7_9AGAR|nr:hypothetical protein B0H15DRAFT_387452 [Mycena belliae]
MTQKQLIQRASSSDLAVSLIHAITDILLLTRPDAKESRSRKAIEAGFGDRLKSVVHLVLALNRAIGADAVSEGLEAVFVEPGARFEPNMMETSYPEDGPGGARDSVVCTTAVGLRKKGRSAGADRDGKTMMVMKPKVLLSSTLLVLME